MNKANTGLDSDAKLNQRVPIAGIMTTREWIGLVFLIVGVAIVPLGWIVSHKILLFAGLLLGIGAGLFLHRACAQARRAVS